LYPEEKNMKSAQRVLIPVLVLLLAASCSGPAAEDLGDRGDPASPSRATQEAMISKESNPMSEKTPLDTEVATFGAGCFWCVEAVFERLEGVVGVASAYMGGAVEDPTYDQVCAGATGHAEVVQVTYDPARIRYEDLLDMFCTLHDPTTLNRQGGDVGTQYRSVIFHHSQSQRKAAEASRKALEASKVFQDPIVTEIVKAATFYKAEAYHQDYFRGNRNRPYCHYVILPKLNKLGLEK